MDILNYQGNKAKLLSFIKKYMDPLVTQEKALLDIFSGGASVSAFFAEKHPVISNDLEPYAYHIANSLICSNQFLPIDNELLNHFEESYLKNYNFLFSKMGSFIESEDLILNNNGDLITFYKSVPTLWNNLYSPLLGANITVDSVFKRKLRYCLFTLLYSSNYFGLKQAVQIDSIVCAIESLDEKYNKSLLYASLFYSMNKCVFSKDGHMAQPLNIEKNLSRCFRCRGKSIIDIFYNYLKTHKPLSNLSKMNKAYNLEFEDLLKNINPKSISCIYADPPYTDMQYSRYYHLLNIACEYEFANPTIKGGKYSSGLYLDNRRQSGISVRRTFLDKMRNLCLFAKNNCINLVISFGYPSKNSDEKKDRYLCSISDLNSMACEIFGKESVSLVGQDYEHANQRNSRQKKVIEYLVVCKGANHD